MNCPKCGKEMESGTMYTEKYPFWTQQEAPPVFRAPRDMVRFRPVGDTSSSRFSVFPFHEYPDTMHCRACGITVFSYQRWEQP